MGTTEAYDELLLQDMEKRKESFDIVRLVKPLELTAYETGDGRDCGGECRPPERGENSSVRRASLEAYRKRTTLCKTEFLLSGAYFVVSQYVPYGKTGAVVEMIKKIDLRENIAGQLQREKLTGLYNRAFFEEAVESYLKEEASLHGRQAACGVFIMLDIDDFKLVNDSLGHNAGDQVLKRTAEILSDFFRAGTYVCRLGGDEFSAFLPAPLSRGALTERLTGLSNALCFREGTMDVTCSIGACVSPDYGIDYQTLYKNADMALLTAKRYGKKQFQIYSGENALPSHVFFRNMDWLLDEITDGIVVCDRKTYEVFYVNDTICKLTGKDSKKECLGKKCHELMWNKALPCQDCQPLDSGAQAMCRHELTDRKTNRTFVIRGKLINWGGHQARIQYIQDITSQARLMKKLEAAAKEKDLILDMLPGGLFRYEADGRGEFNFISRNLLLMLGYTREEFVKKFSNRFDLMVCGEDRARVLDEINRQIENSNMDECDYHIEKKDGTLCWVKDIGHLVTDENGKRWFYVTITDISSLSSEGHTP